MIFIGKKELFFSFLLIVSTSIGMAYLVGILDCGMYLADDHEIIRIYSSIETKGFFFALKEWLLRDFSIRFRPVYWIERVSESYFLGTNFYYWHLYRTIEAAICFWIMYIFARSMGANKIFAVVFILLCFLGPQGEILYRLGPQELIGVLFLFLSLMFAEILVYKKDKIYKLIFIFVTIIMMLTKESFLLVVPGILVFLIISGVKKTRKNII